MVKNKNKKQDKGFLNIHPKLTPQIFGSVLMLILMVASIVAIGSGSSQSSNTESGLPSNIDFQQFDQEGVTFWGAIKNKEQFIFMNITNYENRTDLMELSDSIKAQSSMIIYQDKDFQSYDSKFLIQKAFKGLQIELIESTEEPVCNANSLVLTYDKTLSGDCLQFVTSEEKSYNDAENLVYFLVQ